MSISFRCTQHTGQSRPGEKVEFGKVAGEARREGKNPSTENRRAGGLPPREKVPEEMWKVTGQGAEELPQPAYQEGCDSQCHNLWVLHHRTSQFQLSD